MQKIILHWTILEANCTDLTVEQLKYIDLLLDCYEII